MRETIIISIKQACNTLTVPKKRQGYARQDLFVFAKVWLCQVRLGNVCLVYITRDNSEKHNTHGTQEYSAFNKCVKTLVFLPGECFVKLSKFSHVR